MQIILTHEQADFDAIASLLGAHILNTSETPVLPRRMNRNVRAFLTLYGVDLPFTDPRDLSKEEITSLTLVDTQSYVSIKGMEAATKIKVIDHHPLRDPINPDWTIIHEELGATTTLLVEAIQHQDILINTVEATLLLLGIYEDTGSLTYTRTTDRDLRAAAFLLSQGADLRIANNFLNHPLSQAQQDLYDKLRSELKYYHFHGFTIIIACGDATEMDEELSTIAHKLRDLLDPDAIFLLIRTRGGIQMIARSTSDNIDVAKILARFGGGGHERAAAGLVRDTSVDLLCNELIRILPDNIQPPITVAQIMSPDPHLLSPTTSVDEAAETMKRYGYEGYPVVKNGEVIGLLTRRSVDRALNHNLNLTAASLMEAGNHYVQPEDSVEHLKRVVTESGWGQIPVIDPETSEIIGIVTRTDLLKTLPPQPRLPSKYNLASRLEATLPDERVHLLKIIAETAHKQHSALYIVGGFIRDMLLKLPSLDFDLVVEGDAIVLAKNLAKLYGGRVTSHARFGTAKWILPEKFSKDDSIFTIPDLPYIDLVTARTEFYSHPTALPKVERGSIKLDLHRRDFTINTLALRLDGYHYGELHDYWGGYNDIKAGLVRVLHSLSFVDDPTRMLRAVQFEQRFKFKIGERTLELLKEALTLLVRISGDRIRHELDRIINQDCAPAIFARLEDLELLRTIHPDLTWNSWLGSRFDVLPEDHPDQHWELSEYQSIKSLRRDLSYVILLIRKNDAQITGISNRLKLPFGLKNTAIEASMLWQKLPLLVSFSPSDIVDQLEEIHPLARYAVYISTSDYQLQTILQKYATRWRLIYPTISGHNLKEYGVPPGPDYKYILKALRDAWLDEKISDKNQESILLEKLLKSLDYDVNIK